MPAPLSDPHRSRPCRREYQNGSARALIAVTARIGAHPDPTRTHLSSTIFPRRTRDGSRLRPYASHAKVGMAKALNVLLVEDSEDDAAFVLRELKRSAYEIRWERV